MSVWRIQWLEFLATALIGAKVLEVYSRCFCAFFSTVKKVNLILLLLWKSFWTCGSHERICKLPRVSRPCFENHWFKRCCLSYYYSNKNLPSSFYSQPLLSSWGVSEQNKELCFSEGYFLSAAVIDNILNWRYLLYVLMYTNLEFGRGIWAKYSFGRWYLKPGDWINPPRAGM